MKQAQMLMQRKREKIEAQKAARRKAREEQERLEEERRREEERKRSWKYWLDKNLKFW
jgi:cytochrome c oxidase assembly protein subunit 20